MQKMILCLSALSPPPFLLSFFSFMFLLFCFFLGGYWLPTFYQHYMYPQRKVNPSYSTLYELPHHQLCFFFLLRSFRKNCCHTQYLCLVVLISSAVENQQLILCKQNLCVLSPRITEETILENVDYCSDGSHTDILIATKEEFFMPL